jgi:SAM-dependent methyltransferase
MAKAPQADFDTVAAAFADYGTTVRGYVRYKLTRLNLKPFIAKKKLHVLDVGGGSGADAAWLAKLGHEVTFIEPSIEQRRFAERRFNFLLQDSQRARIHIAEGTLDDSSLTKASFDVLLLHTVALFQVDPDAFIQHALQFVKPGGIVSVIEKGYYGVEFRDICDGNFADLARLRTTGYSVNNLKQSGKAFKPEELEILLGNAGFTVLDWSGIRLITDDFDMPVERIPANNLKLIIDAEYRHGHHPAIRGQGQLLHFIARKND